MGFMCAPQCDLTLNNSSISCQQQLYVFLFQTLAYDPNSTAISAGMSKINVYIQFNIVALLSID